MTMFKAAGTEPIIRRRVAAALICLLALALTGCGGDGGSHGESEAEPPDSLSSADPLGDPGEQAPEPKQTGSPAPGGQPAPAAAATEPPKGLVRGNWVCSIPDYVPRFAYGEIDIERCKIGEAAISTVFHLTFDGVDKADVDEYHKALRASGYITASALLGDTYTLTASRDFGWNSVAIVVTLTEHDGVAVFALDAPI